MADIVQPLELVAGVSPATGVSMNVPPSANRIRGDNYSNQWVHITGPVDRYIQPFQTGISWAFTLPFSQSVQITATFEAPPGWNQAAQVSGQKCVLIVSEDAYGASHDSSGFPAVSTNVYVEHFEDNADPAHPYSARFYIPRSIMSALAITLSYLALPYRYYTGASAASTATSTATETSAGAQTVASAAVAPGSTDAAAPGSTDSATPSTSNDSTTEDAQHNHSLVFSLVVHNHTDPQGGSTGNNTPNTIVNSLATPTQNDSPFHAHPHSHTVAHAHTFTNTHLHAHTATHAHNVTVAAHQHAITVTTTVATTVTMLPQIVEELTTPSWGLVVDGTPISAPPLDALDLDILPTVMKDASGVPTIGWHTIAWTPATRTRLQADLVVQLLVSAGGLTLGNSAAFAPAAFAPGAFAL